MVVHIKSVEEFEGFLNNSKNKLVVVDFTASWCGPCRHIGPIFKNFSEDPENKNVVFLKVDVDEVPSIVERYSISAMPTFLFFRNGENLEDEAVVGANENKLRETIAKLRT